MEGAILCLKTFLLIKPIPSLPNHFPFHGGTFVENSTKFESWDENSNSFTTCAWIPP